MDQKNILLCITVLVVLSLSFIYAGIMPVSAGYPCSNVSTDWTDSTLCGHGNMIAIIVTSNDPALENELATYNTQHDLPVCTVANGCLEIATPSGVSNSNPSASSDVSPYIEQAHQASPGAKILVVEAKSISWQDKWDAVYYAERLPGVEKISSISYSKVVMELCLILKQG